MSTIIATNSITGFFEEVVEDARQTVVTTRGVDVTDGATSYVVGLLADYARPDHAAKGQMERPLAFLLDEALHTVEPGERFDRLRTLGDAVLYSCGFFADHFEARGVEKTYLFGIGTTAYGAASSMLLYPTVEEATKKVDIFGELSSKFEALVEIISEVADSTIAKSAPGSLGVLKLYERWLKTGSSRLASELHAHGFVPMRGGKGIQ
jgi:hypothetical protein